MGVGWREGGWWWVGWWWWMRVRVMGVGRGIPPPLHLFPRLLHPRWSPLLIFLRLSPLPSRSPSSPSLSPSPYPNSSSSPPPSSSQPPPQHPSLQPSTPPRTPLVAQPKEPSFQPYATQNHQLYTQFPSRPGAGLLRAGAEGVIRERHSAVGIGGGSQLERLGCCACGGAR